MTMENKKSYALPIAMMFALFFMIAFVTGLQNPMGVIIKSQFGASNLVSQLGNFANFIAYAFMGIPAGILLSKIGYKKTALAGGILGALLMGVICIPSNYFVVYPFYYKAYMPEEVVLQMYQVILPGVKNIMQCLLIFNLPFTIAKGLISTGITMLVYKRLSPVLKGRQM